MARLADACSRLRPSPFTREQAFADLGDPAGPAAARLAALDAQIARANADGYEVALTLYQAFPAWTHAASRSTVRDPAAAARLPELAGRLAHDARSPTTSPDGPWAWLVAYLCARYARGGAGNAAGGAGPHGSTGCSR